MSVQWCTQAGIGNDKFDDWTYIGPDWRPHMKKYRLNESADRQIQWIHELRDNLFKGYCKEDQIFIIKS